MSRLSDALRAYQQRFRDARHAEEENTDLRQLLSDAGEFAAVLARIVEGKDLHAAFGAPGDWGYQTEIGQGLYEHYSEARSA